MARRRRRFKRYMKKFFAPRRHRTAFGGRWGVDFSDAALGGIAAIVGEAVKSILQKYKGIPTQITEMPVDALGLYALGVAFNRRPLRSIGLGRGLAVTVFKIGQTLTP